MIRKGGNDNVAPALASLVEIGGNGLACHIKTKIDKTAPLIFPLLLCRCRIETTRAGVLTCTSFFQVLFPIVNISKV